MHTDHKGNVKGLVAEQGLNDSEQQQDAGIHVSIPGGDRGVFNKLNYKPKIKTKTTFLFFCESSIVTSMVINL